MARCRPMLLRVRNGLVVRTLRFTSGRRSSPGGRHRGLALLSPALPDHSEDEIRDRPSGDHRDAPPISHMHLHSLSSCVEETDVEESSGRGVRVWPVLDGSEAGWTRRTSRPGFCVLVRGTHERDTTGWRDVVRERCARQISVGGLRRTTVSRGAIVGEASRCMSDPCARTPSDRL